MDEAWCRGDNSIERLDDWYMTLLCLCPGCLKDNQLCPLYHHMGQKDYLEEDSQAIWGYFDQTTDFDHQKFEICHQEGHCCVEQAVCL